MTPRIGSLFSGAGGLDMAVEAVFGGHAVWHCELDAAASKVLAARWPGVPNWGDITDVNWNALRFHIDDVPGVSFKVDILCGGFPCQDVSAAGRRAGIREGTRSGLWAMFADAIAALRPPVVVIENVRGLLSARAHRAMESTETTLGNGSDGPVLRALGAVLGDLSDIGYDAQWTTVAASDIGAPHRRERVFILATDTSRYRSHRLAGHAVAGYAPTSGTFGSASPTPIAPRNGWHEGRPESAGLVGGSDAAVSGAGPVDLLPTPSSSDCFGPGLHGDGGMDLRTTVTLLPTPKASDGEFATPRTSGRPIEKSTHLQTIASLTNQWGKYEPAIRRWESATRPAPPPTEPNKNGNPRLSARFSEWLMGWPAGWVTDVDISRSNQLRIIGNGVVPQQCAAALRWLLSIEETA